MSKRNHIGGLFLQLSAASILSMASAASYAQDEPKAQTLPPRNEATFRAILEAAKDPNRDVRARVAWTIARMGRQDAAPALNALAKDPTPEVRAAALRAMAELLPPGSRIAVALDVPVEDAGLRTEALAAARRLLFAQRDALIEAALKSESAQERTLALRALELDAPEHARPPAVAALQDAQPIVRAAALRTLGATARPGAAQAGAEIVPVVLPFAAERSSETSFLVRAAACEALGRAGPKAAEKELIAALADEHSRVRLSAVSALSGIGDAGAISAVRGRLADQDYLVRAAACVTLGAVPEPGSAPPLSDRLADRIVEVRDAAQAALAKFAPEIVCAVVAKYADDLAQPEVRRRAWRLLADGAFPGTRQLALAHLDDADVDVHACALHILRKLEDRAIIPQVLTLLRFSGNVIAPPDPLVEEAYQAAILFKLEPPAKSAIFALQVYVKPPPPPPPGGPPQFTPGQALILWAARYLSALDRKEAVTALEAAFEAAKGDPELGPELSAILERMTGRKHPVPPPPPPPWGIYFIEVKEAGEK